MKLTTLLMIVGLLQVSAALKAQHLNLVAKNISLEKLFKQIEKQTGYDIFYDADALKNLSNIDVEIHDATIEEVLDKCFKNKPLDYKIIDKSIVVKLKESVAQKLVAPIVVTGKVTDEHDHPLSGVSIKIKGTNMAFTTNQTGTFAMVVPTLDAVLQFSFIGYLTQEIPADQLKKSAVIIMKEDIGKLDEVQVLAYGNTTKRLNTGDVTTISSKDIEKHPVANVLEAMQNQVPGLFILQKSGNLGGSFTTMIRSGSTLQVGAPLYIVDGVQYPAGNTLGGFLNAPQGSRVSSPTNGGGNALNYLNPNDIESVSVLKDADATALYGSRGAYGVIIITTKRGKAGAPSLNMNISDGITVAGALPSMLNTDQYLMIRREAFKNDGTTPGVGDLDLNGAWPANRYTDWRKYYLDSKGQDQRANLTYQGGTDLSTFLLSGNLHKQRSIQMGKGGQIDGGMRMDFSNYSKNKKFFIDFTTTYNLSRNDAVPWDYMQALTNAPNAPLPILPDGSLDWSTGSNPAAAMNALYLNTNNNLLANLTLRYNFTKDIAFNATIGYSLLTDKEFEALPSGYFVPSATVNSQTTSTINTFNRRSMTLDPNITYNHAFFKQLTVESRIGFTAQDGNAYNLSTTGLGFNSDQLLQIPTLASTITALYSNTPSRYAGAFVYGRFNWANKYLLTLNGRRDGSTSFAAGHRFGNFGSVGGAWILSEEPWMKPIANLLSFAKIRASYGTNGGDQIFPYSYLNTFNATNSPYAGSIGLIPARIANPDLHWESKRQQEVGVNLQFLKGRIEVEGSAYRSWTSDALIPLGITNVTGFNQITVNAPDAKLLSWGYELTLTTVNIESGKFRWSTSFNITAPHSKLLSFPGLVNENSINPTYPQYRLNKPLTGQSLYNYAGVNPQTGFYSFINAQGIQADYSLIALPGMPGLNPVTDKTQFVDLAPHYYGGIGNTFSYNNLSLDFFWMFTSQMGKKPDGSRLSYPGAFNANTTTDILTRWQKPGDITNVPKPSQSINAIYSQILYTNSTGVYTDMTYLRLQNVNLNYKLTGKWMTNAGVKGLSLFIRGENLLTISKFKGEDPVNLNLNALGPIRVFTAGLNISL